MKRPSIDAYTELKGNTRIFGYVTESGEKVPVRSFPADSMNPITIKVQLEHIKTGTISESSHKEKAKQHRDIAKGFDDEHPEIAKAHRRHADAYDALGTDSGKAALLKKTGEALDNAYKKSGLTRSIHFSEAIDHSNNDRDLEDPINHHLDHSSYADYTGKLANHIPNVDMTSQQHASYADDARYHADRYHQETKRKNVSADELACLKHYKGLADLYSEAATAHKNKNKSLLEALYRAISVHHSMIHNILSGSVLPFTPGYPREASGPLGKVLPFSRRGD